MGTLKQTVCMQIQCLFRRTATLMSIILLSGCASQREQISRGEEYLRYGNCDYAAAYLESARDIGPIERDLVYRADNLSGNIMKCRMAEFEITQRFSSDWNKLEAGMSPSQVANILGPYGGLGIFSPADLSTGKARVGNANYILQFQDGKLASWRLTK